MPERPYVKTLNPYSRMALAVRGWGLEVVLAFGVFVLWHIGAALDGPGIGILLLGIVGIVAIFFLFTREIIRFVQFLVLAVAIAVIFYTPDIVKTLASGIASALGVH